MLRIICFCWFFCLISVAPGLAQEVSPFDLTDRLPEEVQLEEEIRRSNGFDSPFDIPPPGQEPRVVNPFLPEVTTDAPLDIDYEREVVQRFALVVSLVLGVILAILFLFFRETISQAWRGLLNNNLLGFFQRTQGEIADLPYQLLYVYSGFSISFFLLLSGYRWEYLSVAYLTIGTWATIGLGLCGLYLAKHLLLKIIAGVFPLKPQMRSYGFLLIVFSIILGLLVYPFSLGLAFGQEGIFNVLIISCLVLVSIWLILRLLRSLQIGQSFIFRNSFHFLLYICAAEIAPIFILLRFFSD